MGTVTRYELQRNTVSVMKLISFLLTRYKVVEGFDWEKDVNKHFENISAHGRIQNLFREGTPNFAIF